MEPISPHPWGAAMEPPGIGLCEGELLGGKLGLRHGAPERLGSLVIQNIGSAVRQDETIMAFVG